MTDGWYYAERNREQRGPLSADSMLELYRSERIGLDTLVWRDGMAQWRPLAEFADELGIGTTVIATLAAQPPPLPAPATPAAPPTAVTTPQRRQGLSSCAIAVIVTAAAGILLLGLLAALTVIALPKYQEYALRKRTTDVLAQMRAQQSAIAKFYGRQGRCPVNGDSGFNAPESYADHALASLRIGRFDNGLCGMEGLLVVPGKQELDGKAIWLDYDAAASSWHCSSEVEDRHLPRECRG